MSGATITNTRCVNHPERDGVGICKGGCRRVICDECSTRLDGINTCLDCLQQKIARTRGRRSRLLNFFNTLLGWGSILVGVLILWNTILAIGMSIPDKDGLQIGSRLYRNRRIVASVRDAVVEFHRDVGHYPSLERGLRSLDWTRAFSEPPPKGYVEGRYFQSGDHTILTDRGEPLDAYGTPLRYIWDGPNGLLQHPIILSAGPDKVFSSSLEDVQALLRSDSSGDPKSVNLAQAILGDDVAEIVR